MKEFLNENCKLLRQTEELRCPTEGKLRASVEAHLVFVRERIVFVPKRRDFLQNLHVLVHCRSNNVQHPSLLVQRLSNNVRIPSLLVHRLSNSVQKLGIMMYFCSSTQ